MGECAAGRTLARKDRPGDLDWSTPCPREPTETLDLAHHGSYPLCSLHAEVIFDALAEHFFGHANVEFVD